MKCTNCGYHKNDTEATHCSLCGEKLEAGGADEAVDPTTTFGTSRNLRRGVVVEQKGVDGPSKEQIVYAGDFAIVYALVPVQGELIVLEPGEVFTLGRGDVVDFKVDAKVVSRRHARIHWAGTDPPVPELVDLESKNGVLVNNMPIQRKELEDGDEITIGPFVATLRVLSANDDLRSQVVCDRLSATMVSPQRLSGEIRLVPMSFLLTHLERLKESGTLTVQSGDTQGLVTLISGVAISASLNDTSGEDAIRGVARLREGRFTVSPRADATPQSIDKSISEILQGGDGDGGTGRRRPPTGRRPPPRRPGRGRRPRARRRPSAGGS